jgi:hypothetical protein
MSRGWSRTDVITVLAGCVVLGCVGVSLVLAEPTGRGERLSESLANLRAIGAAVGQYRADNNGFLPLELTTIRRRPPASNTRVDGWCNWQFGGKNCDSHWFNAYRGTFDVEAADRPLNPYLYPDSTFVAPTPPERLPANDPARRSAQARVFRDPADVNGWQRLWPNRNNPPIGSYDDVGTSYFNNMQWYDQVPGSLVTRFVEGTRRLAVEQGVDPARFVHFSDELASIVLYNTNPNSQIITNHGTFNQSVTLFADGHAGLVTFRPGNTRASFITQDYSVWFEDLGRPSSDRRVIDATPAR